MFNVHVVIHERDQSQKFGVGRIEVRQLEIVDDSKFSEMFSFVRTEMTENAPGRYFIWYQS